MAATVLVPVSLTRSVGRVSSRSAGCRTGGAVVGWRCVTDGGVVAVAGADACLGSLAGTVTRHRAPPIPSKGQRSALWLGWKGGVRGREGGRGGMGGGCVSAHPRAGGTVVPLSCASDQHHQLQRPGVLGVESAQGGGSTAGHAHDWALRYSAGCPQSPAGLPHHVHGWFCAHTLATIPLPCFHTHGAGPWCSRICPAHRLHACACRLCPAATAASGQAHGHIRWWCCLRSTRRVCNRPRLYVTVCVYFTL